jgi:septum formation topological specificity factor MinE
VASPSLFVDRSARENAVSRVLEATANKHWVSDHMPELRREYLNKYVAVDKGMVIAVGENQDSIFKHLKKIGTRDFGVVIIEFITDEGTVWIL